MPYQLHPALTRELVRLGRMWGANNRLYLVKQFDFLHGSPAWKHWGHVPNGTTKRPHTEAFLSRVTATSKNAVDA